MKVSLFLIRLLVAAGLMAPICLLRGQVNLEDGLEVYWKFDEGADNVANDASGNDREAVPADNLFPDAVIDWSGGKFGGSVLFDTTYMLQSPFEYFGIGGAEPRTVSFWIKTQWQAANSSSIGALVGWGINAQRQRIHVKMNGAVGPDGDVLQYIQTENQGGNNFGNAFPINDGVWHHIISVFDPDVDANEDGVLAAVGDFNQYVDVQLETKNGGLANPVETNIDPDQGAVPLTIGGGYFPNIDAARTSKARIDDFRLYSRALNLEEIQALFDGAGVEGPPSIEFISDIEGATLYDADDWIRFRVTPQNDATVSKADVSLILNGREVADQLLFSGREDLLTGRYRGLEKNIVYSGKIGAIDSLGRAFSFEFNFDTVSVDNITIEAEDFNFDGGRFYDNPIICNDIGGIIDNCYFDRVGVVDIDVNDSADDDADQNDFLPNAYRYGPGFDRLEVVDTWVSDDTLREKFNTDFFVFSDFDVERVSTGEWMNYTRTIGPGGYRILLRARAGSDQVLGLGMVDDGTGIVQNVTPLGNFNVPASGTGYQFVPLTDDQGEIVVVELGGKLTLRLTAVESDGDLDLNYLMLAEAPQEPEPEPVDVILSIALDGDQIRVTQDVPGGVLQRSASANGPWEDIGATGDGYSPNVEAAPQFFRVIFP